VKGAFQLDGTGVVRRKAVGMARPSFLCVGHVAAAAGGGKFAAAVDADAAVASADVAAVVVDADFVVEFAEGNAAVALQSCRCTRNHLN